MPVRCVDLSLSGEWANDEDLINKLAAALAAVDWIEEAAVENVTTYGPEDNDETMISKLRMSK